MFFFFLVAWAAWDRWRSRRWNPHLRATRRPGWNSRQIRQLHNSLKTLPRAGGPHSRGRQLQSSLLFPVYSPVFARPGKARKLSNATLTKSAAVHRPLRQSNLPLGLKGGDRIGKPPQRVKQLSVYRDLTEMFVKPCFTVGALVSSPTTSNEPS